MINRNLQEQLIRSYFLIDKDLFIETGVANSHHAELLEEVSEPGFLTS